MERHEVWRKFTRGRWWSFDAAWPRYVKTSFFMTTAARRRLAGQLRRQRLAAKTRMLIRLDRAERKFFAQ